MSVLFKPSGSETKLRPDDQVTIKEQVRWQCQKQKSKELFEKTAYFWQKQQGWKKQAKEARRG